MNRLKQGLALASIALLSACSTQAPPTVPVVTPSATPATIATPATPAASPSASADTEVGSAQVDGLTFSVLSVSTRDVIEGRSGVNQKGHWLAVMVRVANQGTAGVTVNGTNFELKAKGGKSYLTDDPAIFQAAESDELMGEEIAPGASAEGLLLFAVSKSASGFSLVAWTPRSSSDPGVIALPD